MFKKCLTRYLIRFTDILNSKYNSTCNHNSLQHCIFFITGGPWSERSRSTSLHGPRWWAVVNYLPPPPKSLSYMVQPWTMWILRFQNPCISIYTFFVSPKTVYTKDSLYIHTHNCHWNFIQKLMGYLDMYLLAVTFFFSLSALCSFLYYFISNLFQLAALDSMDHKNVNQVSF